MNFKELMSKLSEIEGSGTVPHDSTASPLTYEELEGGAGAGDFKPADADSEVEECGPMSMGMSSPSQQDSVSVSVNMNGSGKGGIHDILDILRGIEGKDKEIIDIPGIDLDIGSPEEHHDGKLLGGVGEELANEPDEVYSGMDRAVPDGDDLHRSKQQFHRAQPGDNAMAAESLKLELKNLYQEIKNR